MAARRATDDARPATDRTVDAGWRPRRSAACATVACRVWCDEYLDDRAADPPPDPDRLIEAALPLR
jgi:hypothetical protein